MKLIEALAAPRRAELAQKAAELAGMVRKMSPSQALGGISIDPGGSTTVPQNDLNPTTAVRDGFKKNVWVYACVTRLASAASSLMWRVEKRTGEGERDWEPDPNDWRTKLLAYPNRSMSAKEVFYYAFAWLAINGNGLLRRVAGGGNGPNSTIELWPASPVNVQPVPGPAWIIGYNILENGKVIRKVDPEEFIHCRLPDPLNPIWGVGMLQSAWASVQADVASAEWRKTLYASGGVPPGAITDASLTTTELVTEAHAQLKRAWQRNAKEVVPMVLGAGTNYLPFGFSAADMMIPQDRELTVAEIATAFGMLPAMFDSSAATYDNLRTAVRFMYDNGVLPLADIMRDALNLSLLTDEERESDSVYITYDLTQVPFFRAEREAKIEQLGKAIRSGISRNDGVNLLDLGLEDTEGGDSVFIETGLTLLSEAAEGIKEPPVAAFASNPIMQPNPDDAEEMPGGMNDGKDGSGMGDDPSKKKMYNPAQPRDPGGDEGGQWISEEGMAAESARTPEEHRSAASYHARRAKELQDKGRSAKAHEDAVGAHLDAVDSGTTRDSMVANLSSDRAHQTEFRSRRTKRPHA